VNREPRNSVLFLPCFNLTHIIYILRIRCFLLPVENTENLLLFQEYWNFQTPAHIVCKIKQLDWDPCRFGHVVVHTCVD
jgi:hypothetical protein